LHLLYGNDWAGSFFALQLQQYF